MKKFLLVLVLALASACGSDQAPAAPTAPALPACQTNNTATVALQNISRTNSTYDFLIDNIREATVAPNQTTPPITVSAGAQHSVVTRFTNTSIAACSSTTSFAQCSTQTLTCNQ